MRKTLCANCRAKLGTKIGSPIKPAHGAKAWHFGGQIQICQWHTRRHPTVVKTLSNSYIHCRADMLFLAIYKVLITKILQCPHTYDMTKPTPSKLSSSVHMVRMCVIIVVLWGCSVYSFFSAFQDGWVGCCPSNRTVRVVSRVRPR